MSLDLELRLASYLRQLTYKQQYAHEGEGIFCICRIREIIITHKDHNLKYSRVIQSNCSPTLVYSSFLFLLVWFQVKCTSIKLNQNCQSCADRPIRVSTFNYFPHCKKKNILLGFCIGIVLSRMSHNRKLDNVFIKGLLKVNQ